MKRKSVALAVIVTLCSMLTIGCGDAAEVETAADAVALAEDVQSAETSADGGAVSLTVWAEETNHEVLGKMIDSFKQEYAGQAEFDIQIVTAVDAETKS